MHRSHHRGSGARGRVARRRDRGRVHRRRSARRAERRRRTGLRPLDLVLGAAFAAPVAAVALRAHALTRGGALAAFVVGTLTYGLGGSFATIVLLAFFIPSVALSRLGRRRKRALTDIGKGGPRDALQVVANGGAATVCLVVGALAGGRVADAALGGVVASYAVATADTWATEIGTLARGAPRSILTLRKIAPGLSGGVTFAGLLASLAGAVWIGLVAGVMAQSRFYETYVPKPGDDSLGIPFAFVLTFLGAVVVGFAGSFLDSLAGASIQELRRCPVCDRACETNPHDCGTPTELVRGIRGATNDVVNLIATVAGAAAGYAVLFAQRP